MMCGAPCGTHTFMIHAYTPYTMKKLLVTGSSGFIGRHLVQKCQQNNYDTYGLERKPSDLQNIIQGDLTDSSLSVGTHEFDCVFHLGALTPLERDNKKLYGVNVDGVKNMWNAVRDKTKCVVYVSGLGIYGNPKKTIDESTPYNPDTKFARMRLEAHKYLQEQCKDAGVKFSAAVLGDVYGPGGWFHDIIIDKLQNKNPFLMPGGGNYQKAFLHVHDAAGSILSIYESGLQRESYVVASPERVTFREFLEYTAKLLNVGRPRAIPAFAAKMALGSDLVKLLCTPTSVNNDVISEIYEFEYPQFHDGLQHTIENVHSAPAV